MKLSRVVEYVFFFGLLGLAGYMVWLIMAPFVSALALAAIIVTICHPLHERIAKKMPYQNRSLAAFATTMIVLVVIVIPLVLISSLVVREVVSFYQELNSGGLTIQSSIDQVENTIQQYIPAFDVDLTRQIQLSAEWFTGNLGVIFAGTVSTVFAFFIALIGSFYFFHQPAKTDKTASAPINPTNPPNSSTTTFTPLLSLSNVVSSLSIFIISGM